MHSADHVAMSKSVVHKQNKSNTEELAHLHNMIRQTFVRRTSETLSQAAGWFLRARGRGPGASRGHKSVPRLGCYAESVRAKGRVGQLTSGACGWYVQFTKAEHRSSSETCYDGLSPCDTRSVRLLTPSTTWDSAGPPALFSSFGVGSET